MSSPSRPILVQKYGGATLADPDKIKAVAARIVQAAKTHRMIIAVSAMGKTTNDLITLAHQVAQKPLRREMDMLLSVGERISMSLLSMALNDLGADAISFTGSQAGIMTDDSHANALITDIKPSRVQEALAQNKIVVIAGFQGVSPKTKEITTLGRGGTDTTAVALAAHFMAERCEILKDVAGVFTADPRLVPQSRLLSKLNYDSLLEMTYWGAQVLHYRSVELAQAKRVPLFVGLASDSFSPGTRIFSENDSVEISQPLSINSHRQVLKFISKEASSKASADQFLQQCEVLQIPTPQVLNFRSRDGAGCEIFVTAPEEIVSDLRAVRRKFVGFELEENNFSSISITCTAAPTAELTRSLCKILESIHVDSHQNFTGGLTVTFFVGQDKGPIAVRALHSILQN